MAEPAQFANEDILSKLNIAPRDMEKLPFVNTVDEATLLRQELEADKKGSQFFTSLGNSIQEEHIATTVLNNIDRIVPQGGTPVSKFTPELLESLTSDLTSPIAMREVIEDAQVNGAESALRTKQSYLRTQRNLAQIQSDGWSGITANVLAAMFDPVEWGTIAATTAAASSVGTPAAGGAVLAAGTAKRFMSAKKAFTTAAIVGGAETAAFEAIRANFRYDITGQDVFIAGGIGAGLSGALTGGATAFIRAGQRATIAQKIANGDTLTDVEQQFHDQFNVDVLAERIIDRELSNNSMIDSIDGLPTLNAPIPTDADVAQIPEIAGISLFGLRDLVSTGYRMGKSELGWSRWSARALGMNSVGYKGGKLETGASASEFAERLQGQYRSSMATIMPNNQMLWKKRTGGQITDFNQLVSRYVRGIDIGEVPAEVKEVGDATNKIQREIAELAVKNDVAGFSMDMLNNHSNYMSRIFNEERIRGIVNDLGADAELQLTRLVEEAIRRGQPNLEASVAKYLKGRKGKQLTPQQYINKIATAYTKSITDPKIGNKGLSGANEMNLEDLADLLKAGNFSKDEINDVTEILTRTNIPKAHKRARHRLVLDEGASLKLQKADGSIEEYRFSDLLEEDAELLFNSYIFQMSGAIGLAKNGINTNQAGSSFDTLVRGNIEREGKAENLSSDAINKQLNAAQFMYDGLTGRLAQRSEVSNRARDYNIAIRAFSFAVNMGMSGMSSLMEITNVLFETSFKTILKSAPEYRMLLTKLSNGQDPELVNEMTFAFGVGQEVALGKWQNVTKYDVTDDIGIIAPERAWADKKGWTAKAARGTEKFALGAQKNVAYWSGLTGVTQVFRRLSTFHFSNEWINAAKKGSLPFSDIKRQQLGLSNEMSSAILKIMGSNIVEKSPKGNIKKFNFDKWPPEVADAFRAAGYKEARQSVQESNIASTNGFMRGELGKTMFQFLNYTMSSLEQQTMRQGVRLRRGDMAVAKILLSSAFMGGLMYATRVHMNATGRSDADEYIKKQLSPAKWSVGALNQIGAVSIFSYLMQVTTGGMQGNTYAITPAAFSIGQGLLETGKNIGEAVVGDETTEAEWRKGLRLLPYQSLYGSRQIINGVANAFGN